MKGAKKEVQAILEALPDDVTLEDIQYHIYVRQRVLRGLADERAGRVSPQKDVEKRMRKWTRR